MSDERRRADRVRSQERRTYGSERIARRIAEDRSRSPFEVVDDAIRFSLANGVTSYLPRLTALEAECETRCREYAVSATEAEYFGDQGRPWSIRMEGKRLD